MSGSVSGRLKEARLKTGKNQQLFAALAGVSRNSQVEYESGKTAPNTDYLVKLAGHGIDVAYIVTGQSSSTSLSEEASRLLIAFEALGADWRHLISEMVEKLTVDLAAK